MSETIPDLFTKTFKLRWRKLCEELQQATKVTVEVVLLTLGPTSVTAGPPKVMIALADEGVPLRSTVTQSGKASDDNCKYDYLSVSPEFLDVITVMPTDTDYLPADVVPSFPALSIRDLFVAKNSANTNKEILHMWAGDSGRLSVMMPSSKNFKYTAQQANMLAKIHSDMLSMDPKLPVSKVEHAITNAVEVSEYCWLRRSKQKLAADIRMSRNSPQIRSHLPDSSSPKPPRPYNQS